MAAQRITLQERAGGVSDGDLRPAELVGCHYPGNRCELAYSDDLCGNGRRARWFGCPHCD